MSTRLGSNTKPASTQEWTGLNTLNQQAHLLTMPSGGPWKVSRLGGWLAGKDADVTAYLCIWNSSGTLLARSAAFTAGGLAFALGNSTQYEADLTAPIQVAGSAQVYVGWSRNPAGAAQWGRLASGTHYDDTQTGSYPGSLSGKQADGNGDLAAWLYYDPWNTAPNAPTLTSPVSGARVGLTPTLAFTHTDPNGDALLNYDLQVSTDSTFASVTHWNISSQTTGINGNNVSRAYGGTALTRGTTYWWRARTTDPGGLTGAWSAGRSFVVNRLPTVTKVSPAAGNLAYIYNLGSDLAVWTSGGAHARPRLSWTYSDPDGGAQYAYQARLYDAGGSQLWSSGKVISTAAYVDVPYALVMGTTYQWSITVWDQNDEQDTGAEAKSTFRVRWGQAIYEYNAGTGSSAWAFSSGNVPANTSKAFLYATATGTNGTGRSAWTASIGTLNPANGPYLNVLVRLATQVSGTQPSLPDMTFRYIGASILPDKWDCTPSTDWALDTDVRRYGTQCLKVTVLTATGNREAHPFTLASGDDIAVQPGTKYTLSAFVRTNGALKAGAQARLAVYNAGDSSTERTDLYLDASHRATTDSTVADQDGKVWPEGWQRLRLTFQTDTEQDRLRPMLHYLHNGADAGDVVWWDAVKLEEGTVATAWTPGFVGDPVVLDAGGIAVDASAGGIFRLRGIGGSKQAVLDDLVGWGGNGSAVLVAPDISADQDNYNPASLHQVTKVLLNATAPVTISGLHAGVEGEIKILSLAGTSWPIRFLHASTASDAANRFSHELGGGAHVLALPSQALVLRYGDVNGAGALRWDVIAQSGPTHAGLYLPVGGMNMNQANAGAVSLAAVSGGNAGAVGTYINVTGYGNGCQFWVFTTDTATARSLEVCLYHAQSGRKVPNAYYAYSYTPTVATWRGSGAITGFDLSPGGYLLVVRNTSATQTASIGLGAAGAAGAPGTYGYRTGTVAALGNTQPGLAANTAAVLMVAITH